MWVFAGVRTWAGVRVCVGVGAPVWVSRGVGVGVAVSSWVYVWVSVWVCGRPGGRANRCVCVWVFFWLKTLHFLLLLIFWFILVCFSLYQQHVAQHNWHWSLHTMIGSLRSRMATSQNVLVEAPKQGRISIAVPEVRAAGGPQGQSFVSANCDLRQLINQHYESVFFGTLWSSKAPVFARCVHGVMTTALVSVGRGSPDICPMIFPESFIVVIFQSSKLMQPSSPTLFPSVHSSQPGVEMDLVEVQKFQSVGTRARYPLEVSCLLCLFFCGGSFSRVWKVLKCLSSSTSRPTQTCCSL